MSNSIKEVIKAALIASLDRLASLTVAKLSATHWHLIPDLADRIAFAVTDMPKVTIFVGNMVKDRDAWVRFARELSAQWGVYVYFISDKIMNIPSRMGRDNYHVVVGTREELKAGRVAELESLYMMIVNSESGEARNLFGQVKVSLRHLITDRLV